MSAQPQSSPQDTSGIRSVLSLAPVYRLAQSLIGADRFRRVIADDVLALADGDRMLDLGCGTADILEYLPDIDYLGFDPSDRYVDAAVARFGHRGTFVTSLDSIPEDVLADRTIVTAIGVFHHMDDDTVHESLDLATRALRPGGRFISVDPTFTDDQHRVARALISRDRGQHVRTPAETEALIAEHFASHDVSVRHDLLRTPYTHVIVQASTI